MGCFPLPLSRQGKHLGTRRRRNRRGDHRDRRRERRGRRFEEVGIGEAEEEEKRGSGVIALLGIV